jgi:hypothetical protein
MADEHKLGDAKELGAKERLTGALDAWKKTVDVQQHFNDIELRIRNLGITVLGAVFSVAGLILKDARESTLPAWIVGAGLVLCGGFYFMDFGWYHRLLRGSVKTGEALEEFIQNRGVPVTLGHDISEASKIPLPRGRKMRSHHKIHAFWLTLLGVTAAVAVR